MISKAAVSRFSAVLRRLVGEARRYAVIMIACGRSMNKQTLHTLLGGIVVFAGAVALVLSQGGAGPRGDGYELVARFGSIDGVGKGTKVLLTGIEVGEVVRHAYEPGRQRAVIHMTLRDDIEIPLDTVAMIVSDGLMGNKYIKLQPGGELEMMRNGDTFEYVQDSIIFEEILEKVILNAETKREEEQKQREEEQKQKDERKPGPDEARQDDPFEIAVRRSRGLKREATR